MDRQTDRLPRRLIFELDQELTQTNILTKFESSPQKSIPVIAAQCSIRERNVKKNNKKVVCDLDLWRNDPKTISVLLSLKVLGWKVFELLQHKKSVDGRKDGQPVRRTDGQTDSRTDRLTDRRCDYYRAPAFLNVRPKLLIWYIESSRLKSIRVITAQKKCGRTDRQTDGQTMWLL